MTNGDKIRAMSDEELARALREHHFCPGAILGMIDCPLADIGIANCRKCVEKWLAQEVEDERANGK